MQSYEADGDVAPEVAVARQVRAQRRGSGLGYSGVKGRETS